MNALDVLMTAVIVGGIWLLASALTAASLWLVKRWHRVQTRRYIEAQYRAWAKTR